MAARRRLGLILPVCAEPWRRFNLEQGFAGIAAEAIGAGWLVDVLAMATPEVVFEKGVRVVVVARGSKPIIAGPGPAAVTASLRSGYLVWEQVRHGGYDTLLAPLAGGIAQPCLMSRAVGESLGDTAILLWGDTPTARRMLDDSTMASLGSLVDDALERTCLQLADAVFAPGEQVLAELRRLGATERNGRIARLPAGEPGLRLRTSAPAAVPTTFAHVGPGSLGYGADRFLSAAERAAQVGKISLLGPWRETAPGLSKTMLGIRALGWQFDFEMQADVTPQDVASLLVDRDVVAVFSGGGSDDDVLVERLVDAGIRVALAPDHRLAEALADRVRILEGAPFDLETLAWPASDFPSARRSEWADILAKASEARSHAYRTVQTSLPSATVCITHCDRPDQLRAAIASTNNAGTDIVPEIIVADVGSTALADAALETAERQGVRVLRLGKQAQGAACDIAAAHASGEILAFLDDDNAYLDGGCGRLIRALADGPFDIVVANLSLYDGRAGIGEPAGRQIFLGDAGSAGLFLNGFGDISFAIRRADFLRLGGFRGYDGPAIDWVFLARARGAGLRIGVLEQPAVAYRRDLGAAAHRWRKRDREGASAAILEAFAGAYDHKLIAAIAMTHDCNTD